MPGTFVAWRTSSSRIFRPIERPKPIDLAAPRCKITEDIKVLANHFVEVYCPQYGLGPKRLAPRALAALRAHPWPGNVRELESLIHRSVVMAEGPQLHLAPRGAEWGSPDADPTAGTPPWAALSLPAVAEPPLAEDHADDLALDLGSQGFAEAKARAIGSFERAYLTRLMEEAGGNVSRAARIAGKERRALGTDTILVGGHPEGSRRGVREIGNQALCEGLFLERPWHGADVDEHAVDGQ